MFLQAVPSTNWAIKADSKTLVPVGPDAIAMLSDNLVICYDFKTKDRVYFKADNPNTCAGISLLSGHLHYPIFAVAESVLRPRIFIIGYPDMEKLTTIYNPDIALYVDIVLSEYDYIVALGDFPRYKLSMWDYRSGEMYAEAKTYKKCFRNALHCIKTDNKVVIQYSQWRNEISFWYLCESADQNILHEVSTIDLQNSFQLSHFCPVTYWESSLAYVINDSGELYWIDVAQMTLRLAWSTPNRVVTGHSLFFNKNGLMIMNDVEIYFIKKRPGYAREWELEWTLANTNGYIEKMISDHNNNMHLGTKYGNIYQVVNVNQDVSLIPELTDNCFIVDFTNLKGIKEEVILYLTINGELCIVDLIRLNVFSMVHIDNATGIAAHNVSPCVAVATKTGEVHFINYEKIRSPIELGSVTIGEFGVSQLRLFDQCAFVRDEMNGVHILYTDYKAKNFQVKASLGCEMENQWNVLEMFLLSEQSCMVFVNLDYMPKKVFADQVWLYTWATNAPRVAIAEFLLPYEYKCFTLLQSSGSDVVEFLGARFNDNIIDAFEFTKNSLKISYSLRTIHFANVISISGSRNVLTACTQSVVLHFRMHKKSKFCFGISRALLCSYVPNILVKMEEYFNAKYLVVLDSEGCLATYRLPLLVDCLKENTFLTDFDENIIQPQKETEKNLLSAEVAVLPEVTARDISTRDALLNELRSIEKAMTNLIDYDISVINIDNVNFQKFCLNYKWFDMVSEEARILRELEHKRLVEAIADQCRIRDWILDLIESKNTVFSTKLHSIFSAICAQSYSTHSPSKQLLDRFDLFRFYEMEPLEGGIEGALDDEYDIPDADYMGEEEEKVIVKKKLKHYILEKGANVYEHVMAKDFDMQDIRIVSFNQLYNEEAKQTIILTDALKAEFNKNFILSKNFKEEILNDVNVTNSSLGKIYSNMNCMLCLLNMEQIQPPELSAPEWKKDENIQRILTVDDSEVKAINRRKKAVVAAAHKSGRMLLWSVDFWRRALMIMMDGVLEKLWEEEIKKTPQPPEFALRKQSHEWNMEEQKLWRQYENSLKLLEDDRKKYLRMLKDDEVKTHNLKKYYIMKLNEHIAEINIEKMKYDFAIKHERLRLLNIKLTNFKRIECKDNINNYRYEIDKLIDYIGKYEKLLDFHESGKVEFKNQYEAQLLRDRYVDRQFKGQYLNMIPQHLTADALKLYKKRPKLPNKVFNTSGICFEIARRLVSNRFEKFPLPQELRDFLIFIKSLDAAENCPSQLDLKYWENLVRLRRQKIESELRLKGLLYSVNAIPKGIAFFTDEIRKLNESLEEKKISLMETEEEYFDVVHNQSLELVLSMGQIEVGRMNGSCQAFVNGVLMRVDDISEINDRVKAFGQRKIKVMQLVAAFRRQVTYKEWEHKVVRANIEYLRYILHLIDKCKVSHEFLEVLRNWHRVKELKATTTHVGLIDDVIAKRIGASQAHLDRLEKEVTDIREQIEEKRRVNRSIDLRIDNLKGDVACLTESRDILGEEKTQRLYKTKLEQAMQYGRLGEKVRSDYVKILELKTILEIKRRQVFDMLPPIQPECLPIYDG